VTGDANAGRPLARAKTRLDALPLYPRPVRIGRVRILILPGVFRLPFLRRFDGYALPGVVLLRRPLADDAASDDLLTHELCHVWQMQHHPIRMPLSYLVRGYDRNPYEIEARRAAASARR
jgi:hypothetical protein